MNEQNGLGVAIPEILLPDAKVNMKKWSVIACDQYTSTPEYWYDVQRTVGNAPSTFHLVLPEAFLYEKDSSDRIARIKNTMQSYVENGVLAQLPRGIVLVERTIGKGKRIGVMVAIDLEAYGFEPGNKSLIRATEETVMERIPPRLEIRRNAILEMPHAMLLMHDEKDGVIGPLYRKRDGFFKLYGFELMQNGGYVNGWFIDQESEIQSFLDALGRLKDQNEMLFAVGDGNHSLVTAKAAWEEAKESIPQEERADHPLRYALVEIVNLFDPAVRFEPIHRVVFNVAPSVCINELMGIFQKKGIKARIIYSRNQPPPKAGVHILPFVTKDTMGRIEVNNPSSPLEAGTLQEVLDEYAQLQGQAQIDYIHGDEAFAELAKQYNAVGFKMPAIGREELFPLIYHYGILPKKCFSIGKADEKRFYAECRLIVRMEAEQPEESALQQQTDAPRQEPIEEEQVAPPEAEEAVPPEAEDFGDDLAELEDDEVLHFEDDEVLHLEDEEETEEPGRKGGKRISLFERMKNIKQKDRR